MSEILEEYAGSVCKPASIHYILPPAQIKANSEHFIMKA